MTASQFEPLYARRPDAAHWPAAKSTGLGSSASAWTIRRCERVLLRSSPMILPTAPMASISVSKIRLFGLWRRVSTLVRKGFGNDWRMRFRAVPSRYALMGLRTGLCRGIGVGARNGNQHLPDIAISVSTFSLRPESLHRDRPAALSACATPDFRGSIFNADGRAVHNAGGTEAQELAVVAASARRPSETIDQAVSRRMRPRMP